MAASPVLGIQARLWVEAEARAGCVELRSRSCGFSLHPQQHPLSSQIFKLLRWKGREEGHCVLSYSECYKGVQAQDSSEYEIQHLSAQLTGLWWAARWRVARLQVNIFHTSAGSKYIVEDSGVSRELVPQAQR